MSYAPLRPQRHRGNLPEKCVDRKAANGWVGKFRMIRRSFCILAPVSFRQPHEGSAAPAFKQHGVHYGPSRAKHGRGTGRTDEVRRPK